VKFFVPYADGLVDAERFWAAMRARMKEEYGLPTTGRRIFALATDTGAVEVGDGTPQSDYEDIVLAILECEPLDNMYFVFTEIDDELEDPPYSLSLDESWRVVDFE
jgi:hypothetical protein